MTYRDRKPVRQPDETHPVSQLKVRTNLRGGAAYPDMSGVCNSATTTPPTGGTAYPDMSGVCNPGSTTPPTSGVAYPDMSGVCA